MVTPDLCKTSYAFAFHHGTKTPDLALIMDKIDRGFWVPAAGYDASLVHRLLWFIVCLIHSRCFVYPCSRIFFLCRFSSAIVRHNLWRDLFLLKDAQSAIDMELFQHTVCFNYSVHVLAWFCEKKKTLPQRFIVLPIAQFWIVAYEVDERGNNGLFQVVLGLFSITFLVFNWTVYPFFNSLTCSFLNSPIMEIWLAWYLDSWLDTITARDFLFCSFCQCISIILCLVYYCAT